MKLKKLAVFISAVMLTACGAEMHGEYYETEKETESMIVSLTEPEPEPEPPVQVWRELGLFLPIVDKYKENTELEDKFKPCMEKIIMGEALLHYAEMFPDNIPYSEELIYPNEWAALDNSFAENKEQLLSFFDAVYTDNYKKGLYKNLFGEELFSGGTNTGKPLFKEENGTVYRRIVWGAKGIKLYDTDFRVHSCNEKTAEIGICYKDDLGYGYEIFNLQCDDGQGWRLDSKGADYKADICGANMDLGSVPRAETVGREDKFHEEAIGPEFVFTRFNETIEGEYIEYNGEKYCQVRNYYPIEKMRKAFENYISEYKWEWSDEAEDFVPTDEPLLQPCIEKYIYDVYAEFSGMLYRKEGAPVYEIDSAEYDSDGKELIAADIETPLHHVKVCLSGSGDNVLFVEEKGEDGRTPVYKLADDIPLREKEK